jgi:hypothetical protein
MMKRIANMRTTLAIDDDVLAAAKDLSELEGKTLGQVISALARQGLRPRDKRATTRNGIPLLTVSAKSTPVSMELVNQLRDEQS